MRLDHFPEAMISDIGHPMPTIDKAHDVLEIEGSKDGANTSQPFCNDFSCGSFVTREPLDLGISKVGGLRDPARGCPFAVPTYSYFTGLKPESST